MTKKSIALIFNLIIIFSMFGIINNIGYATELPFTNVDYTKSKDIRVITDSGQIKFDVSPQIIDGRTLVPIRAIFEEVGLAVAWDNETQTATGYNEKTSITYKIGSNKANVNGVEKVIDVPASIIDGRTMIPLRFLSENMGYNVVWVETSNLILMSEAEIVEEWKYAGYEKESPHKEYERKYINGAATPITRYTGTYKKLSTSVNEYSETNADVLSQIIDFSEADEETEKESLVQINENIETNIESAVQKEVVQTKEVQDDNYSRSGSVRSNASDIKIYLSPSNQLSNLYCTGNTSEKIEMEKVAARVKEILDSEYDCETVMATASLGIKENGRPLEAKDKGCDIYVALHSNAGGGANASGAVGFYHPSNEQGKLLATNIVSELQSTSPIASNRTTPVESGMDSENAGLAEIRIPNIYGLTTVLIETDFHDNFRTANWIINNKDDIARAYVNGIVKTFGISKK